MYAIIKNLSSQDLYIPKKRLRFIFDIFLFQHAAILFAMKVLIKIS